MNIFATDESPQKSAQFLDGRRRIKMILESAQMISFALWRLKCSQQDEIFRDANAEYYKGNGFAYRLHPCTMWTHKSSDNFQWVLDHGIEMCRLYNKTYNKQHACAYMLYNARKYAKDFPDIGLTPFVNCTELKSILYDDLSTIEKYRIMMVIKWLERDQSSPVWYPYPAPDWYDEVKTHYLENIQGKLPIR